MFNVQHSASMGRKFYFVGSVAHAWPLYSKFKTCPAREGKRAFFATRHGLLNTAFSEYFPTTNTRQRWFLLMEGCKPVYLVFIVQVWWVLGWRRPKELPLVSRICCLEGLMYHGLCCSNRSRRSCLKNNICRMHTVAVFFPFPQLTTNKTNGYHSAVTAHHFTFGAPCWKIKYSYVEAVFVLNSYEFRSTQGPKKEFLRSH